MVEIAKFEDQFGTPVATIHKTKNQILEVHRRKNGDYQLTIHRFSDETGLWEDMSISMPAQRFSVLGSIAELDGPRNAHVAEPFRSILNDFAGPQR